jgi:hypothetical protein
MLPPIRWTVRTHQDVPWCPQSSCHHHWSFPLRAQYHQHMPVSWASVCGHGSRKEDDLCVLGKKLDNFVYGPWSHTKASRQLHWDKLFDVVCAMSATIRVLHGYSTGRAGWHRTRTLRHRTLAGLGYTPYPFFQGVNVKLGFYINLVFLYYKQWKLLYIQLIKLSNSHSKRPNMP